MKYPVAAQATGGTLRETGAAAGRGADCKGGRGMTPGGFAAFVVRRRDRRGTRRTCLTGHRIMGAALALMLAASMQTGPVRAEPAGCAWTEWDFWDTATRADVTACIDAGADTEARDKLGVTPLHLAAVRGTAGTVKALIDAGVAIGLTATGFILAVMGVILFLGMFLKTIAIILITTPIVFPVMLELGIKPIWYGILLIINLELALITPPVGMNLFVIKGIADAPLAQVIRGSMPYAVLMLIGLMIVFFFPQAVLFLPDLTGFGR